MRHSEPLDVILERPHQQHLPLLSYFICVSQSHAKKKSPAAAVGQLQQCTVIMVVVFVPSSSLLGGPILLKPWMNIVTPTAIISTSLFFRKICNESQF